jgi:hypothetical protein
MDLNDLGVFYEKIEEKMVKSVKSNNIFLVEIGA